MSEAKVPHRILTFDDRVAKLAANGTQTMGGLVNVEAQSLLYYQHAGRPIFHFAGGSQAHNNPTQWRFARPNFLDSGGRVLTGRFGYVASASTATDIQGLRMTKDSVTNYDTFIPTSASTASNPEDLTSTTITPVTQTAASGEIDEYAFGPRDTGSPYFASGCIYEDALTTADPTYCATPDAFKAGSAILATKSGAQSTDDNLRQRFREVWRFRRPIQGWSMEDPDNAGVKFQTSLDEYRYIHDQTIGDGGTDPDDLGPAITIPLAFSGAGRNTTIRVYVRVYAYLIPAGGGDGGIPGTTGTIGIANRDSDGIMQNFYAPTNSSAIQVTDTTPRWYPTSNTFDPVNDTYFQGCATDAFFDRVLLGAKAVGGAYMNISAYVFFPFHVGT